MRSKPKIVHIITGLNVGGAERALYTLLVGGLNNKFENQVISLTDEGYYGPILREAGIKVICLGMNSGRPSLSGMRRLREVMRANPPDILQGWMYHGNLAAIFARFFVPGLVKVVWNIRTSIDDYLYLSFSRRGIIRLGSLCSKRSDVILFNSNRAMKQHLEIGYLTDLMLTIPNGFDTKVWMPSEHIKNKIRKDLDFKSKDLIIGFIGRDDSQKDSKNFFSAIERVLRTNNNAQIIVIGRGLQNAVSHKAILKQVIFLGHCDKVSELMPAFDILCLSSSIEGFPNVIGEAMACGVPCVTTDVGDAATIVGDTGWIVPPRDSRALSLALLEALSVSQEERHTRGKAARFNIVSKYSLASSLDKYEVMYSNLLF